jgi:N-acetylmuramoyl-L-alanine amidase
MINQPAIQKLKLKRFLVLPSTLIETGYLSNKNEREKLSSQKYQEKLAEALGEAINTYLKESSQKLNK